MSLLQRVAGSWWGRPNMDERKFQRVITDVEVEARIRGRPVTALVYDLSQGGCMIELAEPVVRPSDSLRLRFLDF